MKLLFYVKKYKIIKILMIFWKMLNFLKNLMNDFVVFSSEKIISCLIKNDASVLHEIAKAFSFHYSQENPGNPNFISYCENQIRNLLESYDKLAEHRQHKANATQILHLVIDLTKKLSENEIFPLYLAEAFFKFGQFEMSINQPGLAIDYFLAASNLYQSFSLHSEFATCYSNIAYIHYKGNRLKNALDFAIPAQQKLQQTKYPKEYAYLCDLLSLIYIKLEEKELAIKCMQDSCRSQIPVIPKQFRVETFNIRPVTPPTKNPRLSKLRSQENLINNNMNIIRQDINELLQMCT